MNVKPSTKIAPGKAVQTLTDLLVTLPADLNYTLAQISKKTGIDFYKYRNGISVPGIKSIISGFNGLDLDPAWVSQLASCVDKGIITFDQARKILQNWERCEGYAEGHIEVVVKRMLEMYGEAGSTAQPL